ncbi:MAG: sulfatase-like hydrolase/transferase [bacterium]|nr:sulfatase-like hydrolase/transferase [bacterium]
MHRIITQIKRRLSTRELLFLLLFLTPFFTQYAYSFLLGDLSLRRALINTSASLLTLLIFLPLPWLGGRYMFVCLYVFQLLVAICELFYTSLYHSEIGKTTFFILFETNLIEASEYLSDHSSALGNLLVYLAVQLALLFFLARLAGGISVKRTHVYLLCFSFLLFIPVLKNKIRENIFIRLYDAHLDYQAELDVIKEIASKQLGEIEQVTIRDPYAGEKTYVLVIGESTGRRHMSLHGYHRATTPHLDRMRSDLFVFRDVISPHSHTIPALRAALTFASHENEEAFLNRGSLIQYVAKAGFQTSWISNQVPVGSNENLVTVLAGSSDETIFVNGNNISAHRSLDEKVLLPLAKVLRNESAKKFIVIHLMGTHGSYCNRYPERFARFRDPIEGYDEDQYQVINCYDNAVLYNDWIISEIIRLVDEKRRSAFVLFFSDHGEDVFDTGNFVGHTEEHGTKFMFEIPFILWTSAEYRERNREKVAAFKSYENRSFMADDLIYAVFDLVHLSCRSHVPARSIFSSDFRPRKRLIGKRDYDTDIAEISTSLDYEMDLFARQSDDFREKIWSHRVNSIGKLREVVRIFRGLELDVVFIENDNIFDVNHPPAQSIGLTLESFLTAVDTPSQYRFWLDFKNLSSDNHRAALERLVILADQFELAREAVIVESQRPLLLDSFGKSGFFTSYYLPTTTVREIGAKEPERLSGRESAEIVEINNRIRRSNVDAVSTFAAGYDFVAKHLNGVERILLWETSLELHDFSHRSIMKEIIARDHRIRVLLIKYRSDDDR